VLGVYGCRCGERNGSLAVFEDVTDSLWLTQVRPIHITPRCVWVGLVRNYLYWNTPTSKPPAVNWISSNWIVLTLIHFLSGEPPITNYKPEQSYDLQSIVPDQPQQHSGKIEPKVQVALHYYYTSFSYWCMAAWSIEIVNFKTAARRVPILALAGLLQ